MLKFLFEISSDDLIDITNSISSNLDIYNIINEYQIIINIVEELKQKCGIKEKNDNPKKIIKDIDFLKKNNIKLKLLYSLSIYVIILG